MYGSVGVTVRVSIQSGLDIVRSRVRVRVRVRVTVTVSIQSGLVLRLGPVLGLGIVSKFGLG